MTSSVEYSIIVIKLNENKLPPRMQPAAKYFFFHFITLMCAGTYAAVNDEKLLNLYFIAKSKNIFIAGKCKNNSKTNEVERH
jgi:hypothetical protein